MLINRMSVYSESEGEILPSPSKPLASLERIFKALIPLAEPCVIRRGESIHIIKNSTLKSIYLITDGVFTLTRKSDCLAICSGASPSIYGLPEIFQSHEQHSLVADSICNCYRVSTREFIEEANRLNLWCDISSVLSYFLHVLLNRDNQLVGVKTYTIVRNKLLELISFPEDERKKMNAAEFIHQRTLLSKSCIHKILSDLRQGDYITIKNGRLLNIVTLPLSY